MVKDNESAILLTAAALGAIAGLRTMSAPALLTHELAEHGYEGNGLFERVLTSENTSRILTLFAGSEMLIDKLEFVPDRTSALPLVGRAVIGSLTAAAYASSRRYRVLVPAVIGAAAALASTFAVFHARRIAAERFGVPDRVLGMIEDGVVLAASRGIAEAMET